MTSCPVLSKCGLAWDGSPSPTQFWVARCKQTWGPTIGDKSQFGQGPPQPLATPFWFLLCIFSGCFAIYSLPKETTPGMWEPQICEGYLDFDVQAALQSVSSVGHAWSYIVISFPCFYLFVLLGLVTLRCILFWLLSSLDPDPTTPTW